MKSLTPLLLIAACAVAACTDSKAPKAPPSVPTPKAEATSILHRLANATTPSGMAFFLTEPDNAQLQSSA